MSFRTNLAGHISIVIIVGRVLLNLSYTDHVTIVEVRNRIKHANVPYEDLLTTVKKRKLNLYSHISRYSGLSKTILHVIVNGGR